MPTRKKSKSRSGQPSAAAVATDANAGRRPLTLRFYGEEFVFDTVSGMFYVISRTAGLIFRALGAGTKPDQLAEEVQLRYGITRSEAMRDIEHFLDNLSGFEPLGIVRT